MLSKAKSLYQVKLILDYLPEEEYQLISKETIDYIEENFEYDENFSIDPKIPLEKQRIDDTAYELLEKIVKQIKKANLNKVCSKRNNSSEINEYINKVKQSNENYETKIENVRLNNLIEILRKENNKIPKAKELLEEYKDALKQKDNEIEKLKMNNQKLNKCIQKIPKYIRGIIIKDFDTEILNKKLKGGI